MPARLAVLELDEVENFVLALQHQIVEAQENGRAFLDRPRRPRGLHRAGALRGGNHIGTSATRDIPERTAGHRVQDFEARIRVDGLDPAGQFFQKSAVYTARRTGRECGHDVVFLCGHGVVFLFSLMTADISWACMSNSRRTTWDWLGERDVSATPKSPRTERRRCRGGMNEFRWGVVPEINGSSRYHPCLD